MLQALWLCIALCCAAPVLAQEQGQLFATEEQGYARLILSFPSRDSLPDYTMRLENGVLSIEFTSQVAVILPDVGTTLPNYLSVARVDPDGRGLRFGLRQAFNFNRIEAGEKLFIDLLPTSWQGMPPPLPQEVVDELAERARLKAIQDERERKARGVEEFHPAASVRIGRNPTFMRLQFDWNTPTTAEYHQDEKQGTISFEWPVDIDLLDLANDLPPEIGSVKTAVGEDGAVVTLALAEGVKPRFYQNSPTQYVLDVDIKGEGLPTFSVASLGERAPGHDEAAHAAAEPDHSAAGVEAMYPSGQAASIKPFVSVLGSTVRVVFPFEQDTPAAVFRRGDTVWMMFDTLTGITAPDHADELNAIASAFTSSSAGDTQLVRIDLSKDRLATLGSEGSAWVLSLGDIMLNPTEPMTLTRRRTAEGDFEITANIARPGRLHDFHDPDIGDDLKIMTAFPPARGVGRTLDYVDFSALRSVHGLVIKPKNAELQVAVENQLAVISDPSGLTVSALDGPRTIGNGTDTAARGSFMDLRRLEELDPGLFDKHWDQLADKAALATGLAQDAARLELAQFLLANRFALEAVGVLEVTQAQLQSEDLTRKIRLARAVADTLAGRSKDALAALNLTSMGQEIDALFWRTIARADAYDFKGARQDAAEARSVAEQYPQWARRLFAFAGTKAALETGDPTLAEQLLADVDPASLTPEDASMFALLSGRIDEAQGRLDEALDTYGTVITADVRPTRAEAIYRTLKLLDQEGRLNLAKATQTLSAEAMLWRGNPLEASMQSMLADFYFRDGQYRSGFETVKQAVANYPESPPVNALRDEAQNKFGELFLDGLADSLRPVEALSLYYDFRQLTPPGARGDEMIRNLARRLVKVDLLPQAAELLQYQLDNRLRGVARTQIAADLAIIYLADRRPQDALRVIHATQLPDVPETLKQQRRILEARAMIDGGRDQLALDLLRNMSGREADLLRIDAHWKARRYAQASELIETIYAGESASPLGRPARLGIIKAAVGYVLAGDQMGLSRIRAKFGEAMASTPEWPMFDLVTGQPEINSTAFKTVAAQVSGIDGINAFLASYRETYGAAGALAPLQASEPTADLAAAF